MTHIENAEYSVTFVPPQYIVTLRQLDARTRHAVGETSYYRIITINCWVVLCFLAALFTSLVNCGLAQNTCNMERSNKSGPRKFREALKNGSAATFPDD